VTNLMNFLFALPLLLLFMLFSGVMPGLALLFLPLIILIEGVFLLGLALAFSAINVRYRDIQHVLGNLLTLLFFLCPILYPIENVPEKFRFTMLINPVALFTEMYQKVFLENALPNMNVVGVVLLVSVGTFYVGNLIFNGFREEFAELI